MLPKLPLRVLVACEYSGTVRDAFIRAGHIAMSCDLLPTDAPGPHYQGDVRNILPQAWDLLIAHPHVPTYQAVACIGTSADQSKPRWANQTDSGQNVLPPSADRWKIRSETYMGIAEAMAYQWGNL